MKNKNNIFKAIEQRHWEQFSMGHEITSEFFWHSITGYQIVDTIDTWLFSEKNNRIVKLLYSNGDILPVLITDIDQFIKQSTK